MSEILLPILDRILLRRPVSEKIGSIYVPPTAAKRDATLRCTVIAVGPSCVTDLAPGDEVICSQHGGAWISQTGTGAAKVDNELFIISEEDILAKVSK